MTPSTPGSACALCERPAQVTVDPPRRTLARGVDPSDDSFSVTVILPDVSLCDEHGEEVRLGDRVVGWCDDPRCRTFGEAGQASACGEPYETLSASNRSRSSRSPRASTKQ
jgi:hypothetical protein